MRTLVETMLPATLLVRLGVYMQTCAHIELAAWQILMALEKYYEADEEKFLRYVQLKLKTRDLISNLSKAANNAPIGLAIRVHLFVCDLKAGLDNRNLAAHGAFYIEEETAELRVSHYFEKRTPSGKELMYTSEPISSVEIEDALDIADTLLRRAVDLRREVRLAMNQQFEPFPPG